MRIRITHETTYTYSEPVSAAIQLLRLTPRGHDGQRSSSWNIETDCKGRLINREDWYGNIMHSLYRFRTDRSYRPESGGRGGDHGGGWDHPRRPRAFSRNFLSPEHALTQLDPAMREFAEESGRAYRVGAQKAHALMGKLQERLRFDTEARPPPRRRAKLSPRDTVSVRISRTSSLRLPVMLGCRRAMCRVTFTRKVSLCSRRDMPGRKCSSAISAG